MRIGLAVFGTVAAGLFAAPAVASLQNDIQDCNKHTDPIACTRVLKSAKLDTRNRAIFYDNRGTAWYNKGEFDRAFADHNEAIRIMPSYASAYNNRARIFDKRKDYDRALADYNEAIRLMPGNAIIYNGRGNAWYQKSDYKRALADYSEAILLDPGYADGFNGRGNALHRLGEFDRAIESFNTAIRLKPNASYFYTGRARSWVEKGDFDRAVADYSLAIRANPEPAVPYNNRGLLWRDKGDYDRALADMDEAIRLDPKQDKAYANRGEIWRLKGDLDRALADQNQQIRLHPNLGLGYQLRGDTYRYKGDHELALADYDKVLAIQPDAIPAYVGRGLTLEKMGDAALARSEFEKALVSSDQNRSGESKSGLETARARLAAGDSGFTQPYIPSAPSKAKSATAVPTPVIATPAPAGPALPGNAQSGAIQQGRRVALVIGNSAYKRVPALTNPQKDAEAVAASLRSIGFETVTVSSDATREKLIDTLRAFANEAEKADWAMVYYAGHGIEVNGQNYLIPVDAVLAADRDVQFEAVPLEQVLTALEGARKLKLVLLDACRDNPFAPQMRRTAAPDAVAASTAGGAVGTRSIGRGLGEVKVQGASLVVFAAKHGQTALDGEGANSPFAVAMVQRIATPGVEINKIFRLVRDDVMEATAGRQEPYTYGSLPGKEDFFFVAAK